MKFKFLLVFGLVLLIATAATAATLPGISSLGTLSYGENFRPTDVAVAANGDAYVTDWFNRAVDVFDYKGNFIMKVSPDRNLYPVSVAVDSAGRVYVGLSNISTGSDSGAVKVYDASLANPVTLGSGLHSVSSIAVDAAKVYVADTADNAVRIYNINTRALISSITSVSTPVAVAVAPSGDIVVLDRPTVALGDGKSFGSRGRIFGSNGALKATLFSYLPTDVGDPVVTAPGGAVVDGQGRIYVSDATSGEIQVYDATGAYVGKLELAAITQNGKAKGMAMGADGRLLVAEPGAVQILGVDAYVALDVTGGPLDFSGSGCSPSIASQNLTVVNNGSGTLAWSSSADSAWILPSPSSGSINGSGNDTIAVSIDASTLSAGMHTGYVIVSAPGAQVKVKVTVTIASSTGISTSPSAISLVADSVSSSTANLSLSVDNGVSWTANADQTWVQITPASGTSSWIIQISADASGKTTGTYPASVTLSADGCSADTVIVPVTLNVVIGATINVTTNIAAGNYTITGPGVPIPPGHGSNSYSVSAGTYTITYGTVKGYKAPDPVTQTLPDGGVLNASGTYLSLAQTDQIIVSRGSGVCSSDETEAIKAFTASGALKASYKEYDGCGAAGARVSGLLTAAGIMNAFDAAADLVVGGIEGNQANAFSGTGPGMNVLSSNIAFSGNIGSVATGDLNGDGVSEIVVGEAAGGAGRFTIYTVSGSSVTNSTDFDSGCAALGVSVAAGDVDGDGIPEVITACATGSNPAPEATIWWLDPSDFVTVTKSAEVALGATMDGVQLTTGDVDGFGTPLIIASTVPNATVSSATVQMMDSTGAVKHTVKVGSGAIGRNVSVASGDVNADGVAEVAIGRPAQKMNGMVSIIRITGNSAVTLKAFRPFGSTRIHGTRVSIGKVVAQ